jgi:hypothetical protein
MHARTVSLPPLSAAPRPARLIALALLLTLLGAMSLPRPAAADSSQTSILQDDGMMLSDPGPTVAQARTLGAGAIRLMMFWQLIAPHANSFHAPRGFAAAKPGAYPASAWAPYDNAIRTAEAAGVKIDLDLLGGAPLWATGSKMPHSNGYPFHQWEPSATDYGSFVRAVATRYSGTYDPVTNRNEAGNPDDLPRVSLWSIWNEPDYGPSLAPQAVPGTDDSPEAPRLYRGLVDAAWSALHATGHGSDTILWGELAPRGTVTFGNFNGMTPMVFLRALYCVGANYRELRGGTASQLGCPTTAAGSRRFAAGNPALFQASGVSDHPYMRWYPPNQEEDVQQPAHFSQLLPNYTTLATIGHLESGLNRLVGVYGSRKVFSIWDTEFGYITDPPKRIWKGNSAPYVSTATAAYYDNWAEYISWKNPRLASFAQYLLRDSDPAVPKYNYGGFASGLIFYDGQPKPGYGAFRLPLYLPSQTASSPEQALEVWGAAKPIHFAQMDEPSNPQTLQILFRPKGSTAASVIATIPIGSAEGYFDTRLRFPASGTVQLAWTYPQDQLFALPGQTVYSRVVNVTVK